MNTLYIVPTPIGNLEDITIRALRILREVSLIAAEDTRTTRILLDKYEIKSPLTAYHEHNKLTCLDRILDALQNGDVAVVSDAGTPGISDPGYELVRAALNAGIKVVPLPGANAALCALIASGLPTDGFVYLGFLPRKEKQLQDAFTALKSERRTLICYESPNRVLETLTAARLILGDRPCAAARELTKLYEEIRRGTLSEVITHFTDHDPRGEFTLVIGGAVDQFADQAPVWDADQIQAAIRAELAAGSTRRDAAKLVAARSGWDRRQVYDLAVDLAADPDADE